MQIGDGLAIHQQAKRRNGHQASSYYELNEAAYHFQVVVGAFTDGVHGGAHVVEDGEDARRSTSFDQLAHDLIVEVVDRRPADPLLHVLFLHQPTQQKFKHLSRYLNNSRFKKNQKK